MCAIAGFILKQKHLTEAQLRAQLVTMVSVMAHRGPDNQGIWTQGCVGLGHARLSIIDLSPAANQPMKSEKTGTILVFNGEIYNFRELRQELSDLGFRFHTNSDTEALLHGYDAWGVEVFNRLRGMFAIAIWDHAKRRLVLARDRFGKKPLYYSDTKVGFLFASEIKALLTWKSTQRHPDLGAINEYLTFQYVPTPRTAFKGINKLPPAHYLVIDLDGELLSHPAQMTRYWELPKPEQAQRRIEPRQLQEELIERFKEAVRIRLISDVPLGAFLSGGVDSSAIVAMMAQVGTGTIKTFSIGFSESDYDERRYARMVAERYNTDHEEQVVRPDVISILPRLVWHYGEPFADPSAVPTYCVSQLARRSVTVALNGDGGDECFFGYTRYPAVNALRHLDHIPKPLRLCAARVLEALPLLPKRKRDRAIQLLAEFNLPASKRYEFTIAYFSDRDKQLCYGDAMAEHLSDNALSILDPYFSQASDIVSGARWADIHTYLPDDLMVKVDVASMAHGLESRSPFLDHTLLEWAMTIPMSIHMESGETKMLLKKAMEPFLPHEVLYRPKMGFGCPVDHWLKNEIKELAYDTLLSQKCRGRGLFKSDYVEKMLDEHCSGKNDHHTRLWALLMLEMWFQTWIDPPPEALRSHSAA